ncbi:low molecular weight protein tyrosine phosphatase family protein [Paenibacillus sp. FSL H7-0331]|uniref:low molecular weight protein tyrosine phosphatase family protein n=1 Tax=Paenibacillus sp. FSL H7-0331 TaxID=1920421 RepID=UPI00096F1151|nr:protein tyrosine phosphatase [Paenibacillus sp. FSL H7-0331]OMF20263.1 protein tyrosine phosphatase [Paenibacillus sp. FSL H7-0331]
MQILFICSKNKWRSLTAEQIFNGRNGHEVKSAGTEEKARIRVTEGHIGWADLIFVMEKKHLRRLKDKFSIEISQKRVICLDILDDFNFMDQDLIEILESRVQEYIEI